MCDLKLFSTTAATLGISIKNAYQQDITIMTIFHFLSEQSNILLFAHVRYLKPYSVGVILCYTVDPGY